MPGKRTHRKSGLALDTAGETWPKLTISPGCALRPATFKRIGTMTRQRVMLKLLTGAFLVCVGPSLAVLVFLARAEFARDLASIEQDAARTTAAMAAIQEGVVQSTRVLLTTLAQVHEFKSLDRQDISRTFRRIIDMYPDYANFHAALPDGTVIASAAPIPEGGVNLADRRHVRDALEGKCCAPGEYVVSRLTFDPVFPFACPVFSPSGETIAVLVAALRLSSYADALARSSLPADSSVVLFDHRFTVLYSTQFSVGARIGDSLDNPPAPGALPGRDILSAALDGDGVARTYSIKPVSMSPQDSPYMYIAVGIPRAVAAQRASATAGTWILTLCVVLLVTLGAFWVFLRRRIADAYRALYDAARDFMNGKLDARTHLTEAHGEIGLVGQAFDAMAASVQAAITDLREAESRFRTLVEQAPEAIIVTDVDSGRIILANQNAERLFGCDREDLMANGIHRFYHPVQPDGRSARDSVADFRRRALAGEMVITERTFRDARGQEHICEVRVVEFPSTGFRSVRSSWLDITQRKQAEEALRVSERQFRSIVESLPVPLLFFRVEGGAIVFDAANPAAERLCGVDSAALRGRQLGDAFASLDTVRFRAAAADVASGRGGLGFQAALEDDCFQGSYDLTLFCPKQGILGLLAVDVTEKLKLQDVLIQTEKMMSVGGLAAGMAHEINNPLSAMIQSAQVLEKRLLHPGGANAAAAEEAGCPAEALRRYLEARDVPGFLTGIREAGARAARIVSSMLEFSRKVESNRAPADMRELLDKAVGLCATDYDLKKKYDFRKIVVERDYDPSLPAVPCTATQVQQVFLNLLKNAAQAMYGARTGAAPPTLWLRTRRDGNEAVVEKEDNGPGMDQATQRKIFEPFYTTKGSGEGTGLGLSVSRFLIQEKHKGSLSVESQVGKGTKFTVRLPLGDE